MKRLALQMTLATLGASVAVPTSASATTIEYALVGSLPTQTYQYTVFNDTLGAPISDFAIFFPAENSPDYDNYDLLSASMPPGWTVDLVPASAVDLGAYGEAYVISSGEIPAGGSLGGFTITFDYTGSGTPGSQMFQIFDPVTLELLETGYTTHGVPDAGSTLAYALIAGAFLVGLGSRHPGKRCEAQN